MAARRPRRAWPEESRIDVRIRRLPSSGPARWTAGALKYFSSAMSATCGELAPPRAGVAAGEGLARDEQERMPALRLQQPRPLEHVRAVAGGRRRPRRRRRGAEELVHHDHGVGTAGREDGEVEDALRLRRKPSRVGRLHRRADARAQVHVPVDRLRARRPRLRRVVDTGAGDDHARAAEHGDQLRRAVVDPERLRVRQAARSSNGLGGRRRGRVRRRRRPPPGRSSRDTARPADF